MPISDDDTLRAWHFRQLRQAIQALATSASDQPVLFPEFAVKADDLAFDFDHWSTLVRTQYEADLSPLQMQSLAAIERKLASMSRDGAEFDPGLWTDAALDSSVHWEQLRTLAAAALTEFGWQMDSSLARHS